MPDTTNGARDDFASGWDGGFGIFGQDHDGDGAAATQTISIPSISIAGETGLTTTISLGALDSEPNFNNYEASDGDGLKIYSTIDAGSRVLLGEFAPNSTGASDLYLDSTGDGIGDSTVNLTTTLSDFTFTIAGTGSSLLLEIELTSTGSFEPLAVDYVRVDSIPEPSTLLASLLGLVFVSLRRRR